MRRFYLPMAIVAPLVLLYAVPAIAAQEPSAGDWTYSSYSTYLKPGITFVLCIVALGVIVEYAEHIFKSMRALLIMVVVLVLLGGAFAWTAGAGALV